MDPRIMKAIGLVLAIGAYAVAKFVPEYAAEIASIGAGLAGVFGIQLPTKGKA